MFLINNNSIVSKTISQDMVYLSIMLHFAPKLILLVNSKKIIQASLAWASGHVQPTCSMGGLWDFAR